MQSLPTGACTRNKGNHVRHDCPALQRTRDAVDNHVCATLWTLGKPCWWDMDKVTAWPCASAAADVHMPPCAGTVADDNKDWLTQKDGSSWPRQFTLDHMHALAKTGGGQWTPRYHAELTRAVAERAQGKGGGQCWQSQTNVLQWFQQHYDLDTQANVNVFTRRSVIFPRSVQQPSTTPNARQMPTVPGMQRPCGHTASWGAHTFVTTDSVQTTLQTTINQAQATVKAGFRACVVVLQTTEPGGLGYTDIDTAMQKAGGKHILRMPPNSLVVFDALGPRDTAPMAVRSDTRAGQKRRQPGNPSARDRWSWDNMRSRVRPPQVCVHSGPIARTRHGSWGEETHFYIFTPPGSDRPPPTADALRDLKERLQATGGPGAINTRLSLDWEPRGKRGRSLHDLGVSKRNVTERKETVRRWKRHWTGTPATGGAGFSHTIPPGHAPATLDSWLECVGVRATDRREAKEQLCVLEAGGCASLEREHLRHAYTVLRRSGADTDHEMGTDTVHQCPNTRRGCARWSTVLWDDEQKTRGGLCYPCALHAHLQHAHSATEAGHIITTPVQHRPGAATDSAGATPELRRGRSATSSGNDTDEPAQSPTKPTSTPPPPVITSTKVKELARVEAHMPFTKGSGVPLPHHARDARAAVSATPPERQAAGKTSATKSMPPRATKTTKTTQHHLVVDHQDRQGENALWLGADMGMDSNGYIVKTVADPSPARRADMRSGDRVLSINKQPPPATQSERHTREWTQAAIQTRCMVMHVERTTATRSSRPDKRPTRPQTSSPTKSPPRKKSTGTADHVPQHVAAQRTKDIVKDPTTSTNHHQTCPCFVLGMGHETIPNAAEMTNGTNGMHPDAGAHVQEKRHNFT